VLSAGSIQIMDGFDVERRTFSIFEKIVKAFIFQDIVVLN
jgi:hypothetical protein